MSVNVLKGVMKTLMTTKEPDVTNTPLSDENVEEIRGVVRSVIVRITKRKVAEIVSISYGSCEAIFSKFFSGFRRLATKFVPKSLKFDQKQKREKIVDWRSFGYAKKRHNR